MLRVLGTSSQIWLQFTAAFPQWARHPCALVDSRDMSCENRRCGWHPIFLTLPGCVYIKSASAEPGNGEISAGLSVYRHRSRLKNDLCLEISQTSRCTLLLIPHWRQSSTGRCSKLFFLVFRRCIVHIGLVQAKWSVRHMKVGFPVKLFFSNVNHPAFLKWQLEKKNPCCIYVSLCHTTCCVYYSFSRSFQIISSEHSLLHLCVF